MGGEDDRAAGRAPLAQQAHHRLAGERVEGAGRLVGQQQRPASGDRPGDRHPLLFTPGQLAGEPAPDGSQAKRVQQAAGAGHRRFRPDAVQFQRERHVLGGGQRREQVGLLEDEADLPPQRLGEPGLVQAGQVAAGQQDPAGGRPVQPARQPQQGRLARTAGPHDGHELARADPQ